MPSCCMRRAAGIAAARPSETALNEEPNALSSPIGDLFRAGLWELSTRKHLGQTWLSVWTTAMNKSWEWVIGALSAWLFPSHVQYFLRVPLMFQNMWLPLSRQSANWFSTSILRYRCHAFIPREKRSLTSSGPPSWRPLRGGIVLCVSGAPADWRRE